MGTPQVQRILDTPSVKLDISRAFVDRGGDGEYELIDETADDNSGTSKGAPLGKSCSGNKQKKVR